MDSHRWVILIGFLASFTNASPAPADDNICWNEGEKWKTDLRDKRHLGRSKDDFTIVGLSQEGYPCYRNRDYGVVGDPIYVGLMYEGTLKIEKRGFEPCELATAGPIIFQNLGGQSVVRSATAPPGLAHVLEATRCFNAAVTIVIVGTEVGKKTPFEIRFPLKQYERYTATFQVGVLFTDLREHSFGLRPDGTVMRITDEGPVNSGPEYVSALVLYGFPHYVDELFSKGYKYFGRDIVNDGGVWDRMGLVLGVGLNQPAKRFIGGLSLELVTGVNVIGVVDFAEVKELNGVAVDDQFSGTAATIPARSVWRRDVKFGLTLDARFATKLFSKN